MPLLGSLPFHRIAPGLCGVWRPFPRGPSLHSGTRGVGGSTGWAMAQSGCAGGPAVHPQEAPPVSIRSFPPCLLPSPSLLPGCGKLFPTAHSTCQTPCRAGVGRPRRSHVDGAGGRWLQSLEREEPGIGQVAWSLHLRRQGHNPTPAGRIQEAGLTPGSLGLRLSPGSLSPFLPRGQCGGRPR